MSSSLLLVLLYSFRKLDKITTLADIIKAGVRYVDETGLQTLVSLCDASTGSCEVLKSLGLSTGGHQVDFGEKMCNFAFDPVHNFKCARKALLLNNNKKYTSAKEPLTVSIFIQI